MSKKDIKKKKLKNESKNVKKSEKKSVEDQLLEAMDGWKRARADYENLKKRSSEERVELISSASNEIVLELLPILDNFNSAFDSLPEGETNNWIVGFEFIKKQLEDLLEKHGVKEMKCIGDNLDPEFHEAVGKEAGDKETDVIVKIQRKGYLKNDKVLRPARVIVSE